MHLKLIYNNNVFFYEKKTHYQEKILSFFKIKKVNNKTLEISFKNLIEPSQEIYKWLFLEIGKRKNRKQTKPFEGFVKIFDYSILVNLYENEDDLFFFDLYDCYLSLINIIKEKGSIYVEIYSSLSHFEYLLLGTLNKEVSIKELYSIIKNENLKINNDMIENLKENNMIKISNDKISITERGNRIKIYKA